ncbi:MAG: hypothetical protein DRJ01_01185 [Bacteroidetes bacterium]|nr:MAG: hypothetical protein DRJ01_01185 [Bacteroidota bacterium]
MVVEIDFKAPERCDECKFKLSGSGDFGRTFVFSCLLTGIGDSSAEGCADQNRAEKKMRKACPFLK